MEPMLSAATTQQLDPRYPRPISFWPRILAPKGTKAQPSRRQGIRAWGPRSHATGQGGGGWNGLWGTAASRRPLGDARVSQGAFVCFLRPQGVFVSFVERLFSGGWPTTKKTVSISSVAGPG